MTRKGTLKVFRTPIGFHDAYVATTSREAALDAWGAEKDLFASGIAELVSDPKFTKAPLATPGEVIKVARGTVDEHLRAASRGARKRKQPEPSKTDPALTASSKRALKLRPRPSRAKLERAEESARAFEADAAAERAKLDELEAELVTKRRTLNARLSRESSRITARLDRARDAYEEAMERWRDQ